jgi:adenosylcobinamide-phosphate synthase
VWAQGLLTGVLLKPMFAFRRLFEACRDVQQVLIRGNLTEARRLVAWHLVSRDSSQLSSQHVASAAIESLAENLTDSFFAPLLCFSVGGLPLAWFYRFINTADAMIGYRTAEYEYFGKFAARMDDLLNWLPSRFAGLFLVVSSGLCRLDAKGAWNTMMEQHTRTSSPNAGWTMASAAGALGVTLEKKGHYRLEGGDSLPEAQDIDRAIKLVAVALVMSLFISGGIIIGCGLFF